MNDLSKIKEKFLVRRSDQGDIQDLSTLGEAVSKISNLTEKFPTHEYEILHVKSLGVYKREIGPVKRVKSEGA